MQSEASLLTEDCPFGGSNKKTSNKKKNKEKICLIDRSLDQLTPEDGIQLLKALIAWCSDDRADSRQVKDMSYDRVVAMMSNCEAAMVKSQQIIASNQLEMKNYELLYTKIESGIVAANKQIASCRSELQRSKKAGGHSKDVARGHCNLERRQTVERLNLLEADIKKMQVIKDSLNSKLAKQRKQFQVLLSAAHELHVLLLEGESTFSADIENNNVDTAKQSLLFDVEPMDTNLNCKYSRCA